VVREVAPDIVLVPSPQDYMEDHMTTSRLAVSAAFTKGMPNYATEPERPPIDKNTTIYHAMPHGLRDGMRKRVLPELVVDVATMMDRKTAMLAKHNSQKEWLDRSQGFDSYLNAMREMTAQVGTMASPPISFAEGWRRHSHVGFSRTEVDPLSEALKTYLYPANRS
jgi:N-acetylglucosamine malate deacetylase 1